jgi:transposase
MRWIRSPAVAPTSKVKKSQCLLTPVKGEEEKKLSSHLPRVRIERDLPADQKVCPDHRVDLVKIGEKVSEKLEIIPAQIMVVEHVCITYKCPRCSIENVDNQHIICSENPEPDPIPKSIATPGLLAYIACSKYQDALPLARLEKIFERYGIAIDRTSMARWMIQASKLATPLLNLMQDDLLSKPVIGCDETPTQVLNEPNRSAETKSQMWVARSFDENPIIIFHYHQSRSAKAALELLGSYNGVVMCDGLKSYDSWAVASEAKIAACLAHIRRKFDMAKKSALKASPKVVPKAQKPLSLIKKLYLIEGELKGLDPQTILEKRQDLAQPIMDELYAWMSEHANKVLPKSQLGKAINYALNQWPKLSCYLNNPFVPLDNNLTEQAIRPFTLGRKNWYFAATPAGAQASAAIYSLVESAKANNIEPFSYLSLIFKELPKALTLEDLEHLLPHKAKSHFELKPYKSQS